nr:hypothetical protein [Rhodococcus ruber]
MTEERLDTGAADRIVGSIVDSTGISRAKTFPAHMLSWFIEVGAGASPSWAVFCVELGGVLRRRPPGVHTVAVGDG